MKRVLTAVLFCIGAFALFARPAHALTEFCPARVELMPVGAESKGFGPAQIYAAELMAFGPRSVMAEIAFDTDAGWFDVHVPWTKLEKRGQFKTPIFYVQFPTALIVRRAWVTSAQSQGDGFGWQSQGVVECLPTNAMATSTAWSDPFYDHGSFNDTRNMPPDTPALQAERAPAAGSTACAKPFEDATVLRPQPPMPSDTAMQDPLTPDGSTVLLVAIDADGGAADAWVVRQSGNEPMDNAAIYAAKHSTYRAATAYCQSVPGFYLETSTFRL